MSTASRGTEVQGRLGPANTAKQCLKKPVSRELNTVLDKKKVYDNAEEAYAMLFGPLQKFARSKLYRPDLAIDAVHDAFERALVYLSKKPEAKLSAFILFRETIRACRRINRFSVEVPSGDTRLYGMDGRANEDT